MNQVVLEEAGVERYVHLRSVEDEYEHLESTLPSRARGGGGAAGGVGGNPPAEGVEGGPGASDVGGDLDTVNEGGSGSAAGEDLVGNAPARSDEGGTEGHSVAEGSGQADGPGGGGPLHQQPQHNQQPDCQGRVGSQDEPSSPPFAPPERPTGARHHDDDAELPLDATKAEALPRRRDDHAGVASPAEPLLGVGTKRTGDKRYPATPPPPSSYHYRSPSCSPRLSPRPGRSPYRQEGVGTRESSGRGDSSRASRKQGHRPREEAEHKGDIGASGDVPGRPEGPGAAGEGIRPDLWSSDHVYDTPEAVFMGGGGSSADIGGVGGDGGGGGRGGGGGDGGCLEGVGSADSGGFGDGYEGSVVFIDNQQSGGGQHDGTAVGDEGWWPQESGSVLRGVDFAFDTANSRADQPPSCAKPIPSATTPTPDSDDGGGGDDVNVSHLIDGLRSGAATPPAVSNAGGGAADYAFGEAVPEQRRDASASPRADSKRDQEQTAPAPFHSHVWGSGGGGAAAAGPDGEGGDEGKFSRVGAAAATTMTIGVSGSDVAI